MILTPHIGEMSRLCGKEIGKKLAEYYNIPFYDKRTFKVAAKESGICEEMFENFDRETNHKFSLLPRNGSIRIRL